MMKTPLKYARLGVGVVMSFFFLRATILILSSSNESITVTQKELVETEVQLATEKENLQIHHRNNTKFKHLLQNIHGLKGQDLDQFQDRFIQSYTCEGSVEKPTQSQIRYMNDKWQLYDKSGVENRLLVYSAFYDDRPESGFVPVLRILGVANVKHEQLYCQIWYEDIPIPHIAKVEEIKSGRGDRFDGIFYGQHLYTCKLISAYPRPTHVSLTTKPCETSSILLPVTTAVRTSWQQDFAICVPIAFGDFEPLDLIEWFEMAKLMGVSQVHVYNASMSQRLNKVLDLYTKEGVLTVHDMPPPVDHFTKKGSKLASPASLNDCMLRHMYKYRYIFFIDFDEIVLPKKASNYSSMLKEINRHHKLSKSWLSYTFRNVYHFLDLPGEAKEKEYMPFLKYRKSAPPSRYMYASKSMIDPKKCLSVFNHYCYIRFPNTEKPITIDVDTNIAMSHHYRKCNVGKTKCEELFKNSKNDDNILRFRNYLTQKVGAVVSTLSR